METTNEDFSNNTTEYSSSIEYLEFLSSLENNENKYQKENYKVTLLSLPDRDLKEIPEILMEFSNTLEYLFLDNNSITILPMWLNQFQKLRILSVRDNNLKAIPDFSKLKLLKIIDISENNYNTISDWILNSKTLSMVNLVNNPLENVYINKIEKLSQDLYSSFSIEF